MQYLRCAKELNEKFYVSVSHIFNSDFFCGSNSKFHKHKFFFKELNFSPEATEKYIFKMFQFVIHENFYWIHNEEVKSLIKNSR